MRVLHVHSGNIWGGVETFLATLVRHEREVSSVRSAFALCVDGEVASRLRGAGAPVHLLAPARLSRPETVRTAGRALASLLPQTAPDVVAIHSTWTAAVFGPVLARAGRPVVRWAHAPDPGPRLERWLARRCPADLVIANSRYTCAHRPGGEARVECIYYPVSPRPPVEPRTATRARLGVGAEETVILIAARLEPWKGHELLLDALGRMPAGLRWRCWIAGGPQRPQEQAFEASLREQCARAGIDARVDFLGLRSDVPDLLAAADVYCQPNLGPEPFGISFVEALAAGLPVVSTRLGAAPEILDDTCGLLTEPRDAGDLASALSALVGSAAERRRLGAAGPARAATLCAPDVQIRRIEAALGSLRPAPLNTVLA